MAETIRTKSGHILTEDDIEALADEAERGYDLSKWHFRPGRPFLDASSTAHSPRIAVRVPTDLRDRVRERARAEGRTVSKVMRDLLEAYAGPARRG
ncbi:MAG: ribbon-helix-helix domain-containing protein [Aeromicrobium sp.]